MVDVAEARLRERSYTQQLINLMDAMREFLGIC